MPSRKSACRCPCNVLTREDQDNKVHFDFMGPQSVPAWRGLPSKPSRGSQISCIPSDKTGIVIALGSAVGLLCRPCDAYARDFRYS
jgi:hypothetical protein